MESEVPPIYRAPAPPPPPPPPAPPARRGTWKVVIFVLVLVVAVLSLYSNVRHYFRSVTIKSDGDSGRSLEEVTVENNHSANRIAVVDVSGIITGEYIDRSGHNMVSLIKDSLAAAKDEDSVKAVILKVDSPGGEVLASDSIYKAVADFQKKSGKPVIAAMGGLAASGGYYVSAPCRWIVAHEMTITGSIGVIMHTYNYRGLMDKVGVMPEVFKSGKFKDMLSGEKEPGDTLPEERQMIQSLIDETFGRFKAIVAEGRLRANNENSKANETGRKLVSNWQELADGRILSGRQAYESGFVDELGDFDAAVKRAQKLANISDANLIRYVEPVDFSSLFRLFGKTEAPVLKIDLGFDLPKLQLGRLYFISPTVLH